MVAAEHVLDAIAASIAVLDSEGRIVSVNEGWRTFGFPTYALRGPSAGGQNYLEACDRTTGADAFDARLAARGVRAVLSGDRDLFTMEYPMERPTGRRWFRMLVSELPDGDGRGAVVMLVDITGSQEAELLLTAAARAARESEQRLEFTLAASKTGDWSLDLKTNVAHRSLRHDECFGYRELLPSWGYDTFLAHVDAVDRGRIDACFQAALAGDGDYDAEFRTTWADGSRHWLWTKGQFYFDEAGEPVQVAGIVADITERKGEQESAEQTLRRLNEAQHMAKVGDWTYDVVSETITWSPEVYHLVGRDERDGPPATLEEVVALFDRAGAELHNAMIATALTTGEAQRYELSSTRPDGRRLDFDVVAVPRCDPEGTVIDIHGTIQDVSEQKQAAAKLQESEQRLELATRSAQIGIWDWNLKTDTLVCDDRTYILMGGSALEGVQPSALYRSGVSPADRKRLRFEFAKALRGEGDYHSEFQITWPNGDVRYLETHGSVQCSDGEVIRVIGLTWDITERKRNELSLMRLAEIVESSDDAMVAVDIDGMLLTWNQGASNMFGYTSEEMVGSTFAHLVPAALRDEMFEIRNSLIRGEAVKHFDTVRQARDGRMIDVSLTASPIRDAHGTLVGASVVFRDNSERKKLEQQVLRKQRMESIGTLAGGIAHDLNNTLAPILLGIDLLKQSLVDEDNQQLLRLIESSAQHGANMVGQLLSFARGVDGQRVEVNVSKLVADVERVANDTFLKNIQVRTQIAEGLWRVVGDPTQLNQVLMNLSVNARDAMPSGGTLSFTADNVVLNAQAARRYLGAKPGPFVLIQVTDSGTGIAPDIIGQIFDPFFTTKEVGKGTGLGLSTTMAIVESHGGFVHLHSEPDVGTTFQVFLPATIVSGVDEVEKTGALPRGHGETVLVVDDEPSVLQVTQHTLEAFGYKVITARDGAEALSLYAKHRGDIAVVLTDMTMPVMDGPMTIRELRRINPRVRIITTSGLPPNEPDVKSATLGQNHVLTKPYSLDRLLTTVKAILLDL